MWRPSDKIHRLFQKIGGSETELLEYWEFEQYGKDLVERVVFEESWFACFRRHSLYHVAVLF